MPRYTYIARSDSGEKKEGTLEAKNESGLARILKNQGFVLIFAQEEIGAQKKKKKAPFLAKKTSLVEKMMFARNLRIMISAGTPLPKALELSSKQVKSKQFAQALLGVRDEIIKGKTFTEGLSLYPDIFSELFSSMINVGEEGGRLEEVLGILAKQMERSHELKSKIMGAMMYPAVIIIAMMGIGVLMLVMVVPKIAETFRELNIPLPPTTRLVIWLGETLAHQWYLVGGAFVLFVIFLRRFKKTNSGKKIIDTLMLKIPIISGILKMTQSAYTTRILSSLIASGVPIARSLEILSGALGNIYYKMAMKEASEEVRKGIKLSDVLMRHQNIYPSMVIQMVVVGEETGQTSEILEKLADFFEDEVGQSTKNLASIIEPIVMLMIGGAVGFFAIAMIQPMYSMLDAVQ